MSCLEELSKILKQTKPHKRKSKDKDFRFNTSDAAVSPQTVLNSFSTSPEVRDSAIESFFNVVQNKTLELRFNFSNVAKKRNPLLKNADGSDVSPEDFIARSVTMKSLFSSIKENNDIANNQLGSNSKDKKSLMHRGMMPINAMNLAHIVGRDILAAQGLVAVSNSQKKMVQIYTKMGQYYLDQLEELGYIEQTTGSVVNNNLKSAETGENIKGKFIRKAPVVLLKLENIDGENTSIDSKGDYPAELISYLSKEPTSIEKLSEQINSDYPGVFMGVETGRYVHTMKIKSNLQLPDMTEKGFKFPNNSFDPVSAVGFTPFEKGVLRKMYEAPVSINQEYSPLFDFMANILETESYGSMVKKLGMNQDQAAEIFGTVNTDIFDSTTGDQGKQLSRTVPMQDFLLAFPMMKDKDLHFGMDLARNTRMHTRPNVLDFQGDNYFSRHILNAGDYSFKVGSRTYNHVMAGINDQSGIPTNDILAVGKNPELDKVLEQYNHRFVENSDPKFQVRLLKRLTKGIMINVDGKQKKIKAKSVWELLDVINGINDVRNPKSGSVTTHYMTKPDATTSGGLITLMQEAGKFPEVDAMLAELGLIKDKNGNFSGDLRDFYAVIENAMKANKKEISADPRNAELMEEEAAVLDKIKRIVDLGEVSERDLYKPPTMTFVYRQGKTGIVEDNAKLLAENYLSGMSSKEDIQWLSKQLNNKDMKDMSVSEILQLPGIIEEVSAVFTDVSTAMYTALDDKLTEDQNGVLSKHNKILTQAYKLLKSVAGKDMNKIKILPPLVFGDVIKQNKELAGLTPAEVLKKYGVPLTKGFETVQADGSILKQEFPNEVSAFVIPQHMIDSIILKMSLADTYAHFKGKGVNIGSLAIHDANNATGEFNVVFQDNYRKNFVEVNINYDIVESLLNSIKASPMNAAQKVEFKKIEALIKTDGKSAREVKSVALADVNTDDVFGFSEGKVETTKVTPQPKPDPEPTTDGRSDILSMLNSIDPSTIDEVFANRLSSLMSFVKLSTGIDFSFGDKSEFNAKDGRESITLEKDDAETMIQELAHEMEHAQTFAYIIKNKGSTNVKYLLKAIPDVIEKLKSQDNPEAYIAIKRLTDAKTVSKGKDEIFIAEVVAILNNEPEVQRAVLNAYQKKDGKFTKLAAVLKSIAKKIAGLVLTKFDLDLFEKNGVEIDKVFSAVSQISKLGDTYKGQNKKEAIQTVMEYESLYANQPQSPIDEALEYREFVGDINSVSDPLTSTMTRLNEISAIWINNAFSAEEGRLNAFSLASTTHNKLLDSSQQYSRLTGYITGAFDSNPLLQQLVHYINADSFDRAKEKGQFITLAANAEQDMHKISNDESLKLDNLIKAYGKDSGKIYDTWANGAIYGAIASGHLVDIAEGNKTLDESISEVESELDETTIGKAKSLANMIVNGIVDSNKVGFDYNTSSSNDVETVGKNYAALVSLYSLELQDGSVKDIKSMLKEDPNLYNELVKWNMLMNQMNDVVYDFGSAGETDPRNYRQNLITDQFEIAKEFAVVNRRDLANGNYTEDAGWNVLRHPTDTSIGIVSRDIGDTQSQSGTGTTVGYVQSDIIVPRKYDRDITRKNDNAVLTKVGMEDRFKIILTTKEKDKLGLKRDTAHSLINTFARLNMIKDTQIIRQELLKDSFTAQVNDNASATALMNTIEDKDIDNPWFVNLKEGVIYDDLPRSVKNKYSVITEPITSVGGFKYKVSLVRNDISPWLLGYKEARPFENNPNLRKAVDVARKTVSLMKIHWILNNPIKIANDIISNETILLAKNVSLFKQYKYAKEAIPQLKDMEDLRGAIIQAKLDFAADDSIRNRRMVEKLDKQFKEHPLAFAVNNGFIQSLSTDIVTKNYNTISGLQKDIEKLLSKVTRLEDGELSGFGEAIMKFGNAGPRIENIMGWAESALPEDQHRLREFFKNSAERISKMKSEKEVDKYFAQFFGSPDSEMTKLGAAATQYADIIPRIILYKHLKDTGSSEQEATQTALETFIDYRVNMPKELKLLSDLGIILFPSFWMRIQKVILALSSNNAASIGSALIMSELYGDVTGGDGFPHIFDANIINRILGGNVFNTDAPTILDVTTPKVIQQLF